MKILMLTESNYPLDIRVRQEAETLTSNGHNVTVIALRESSQPFFEIINNIKIYRIPKIELFKKGKHLPPKNIPLIKKSLILFKAIIGYGFEFIYFTLACYLYSFYVFFKHRFDVIHTHNPPDTLFLVALFWKPLGIKFVYDHHDLAPDLFREKYGLKANFIYQILLLLEKISCKLADVIIATNDSYKKIEMSRNGVSANKIFVVRNGPDLREMKKLEPVQEIRKRAETILCYLGAINIQDGLDCLLKVLKNIVYKFEYKNILLLIIGDGDYLNTIKQLAKDYKLSHHVCFTGFISDREELCRLLSTADIFIDAALKSFLNDNSTFIKHMEYMIFEKPVVSFALKESIFTLEGAGIFVKPNDTIAMAQKVIDLINNIKLQRELGQRAKKRVRELSWDRMSLQLIDAYNELQG